MTKRIIPAILAVGLIAASPLEAAFARGSGGGGGGGGSSHGASDHGGGRSGRPQNADDQRLFDQARQECNGPKYPSGATPIVNYDADTFTCFEPGSTRR